MAAAKHYPEELEVEINVHVLEKDWTSLKLREPTAGEISKASKEMQKPDATETDMGISLLAMIAGVPPAVIAGMPSGKFRACVEYVMSFPKVSLLTGV
jgi:hypothetical protein